MGFLTERERKVLLLIKDGKAIKDIAKELKVAYPCVSRSVSNIRIKAMDIEDDINFFGSVLI